MANHGELTHCRLVTRDGAVVLTDHEGREIPGVAEVTLPPITGANAGFIMAQVTLRLQFGEPNG